MSYLRVYRPFRSRLIQVNLPNILTIVRILLIPVLVIVYCLEKEWTYLIAGLIFTFACLTDWFDGYLARKLKQTSTLGALIDPLADKLIVTVTMVLIVSAPHLQNVLIPAMIIVGREITISSLREWMSDLGKKASIRVGQVGKIKTLIQMLSLGTLLAISPTTPRFVIIFGYILLYLAAIFTIVSMFIYLRLAWKELAASSTKSE